MKVHLIYLFNKCTQIYPRYLTELSSSLSFLLSLQHVASVDTELSVDDNFLNKVSQGSVLNCLC